MFPMAKAKEKKNKRANGDGSIRQRKDGSWEARFITGTDPVTGKPIRKSIYGKSKPDVAEKLRAATSARDKGDYFEPSKLTIRKWFNIWISEYCGDKKYSTLKQYKSFGENHICKSLGSIKIAELTPVHIQRFYNDLSRNGKVVKKKDEKSGKAVVTYEAMSAKSIRNVHGILSKCLNVAVNQGLIKSNPAERVTLPKVIREEIQPLTEDQQKAFVQAVNGNDYKNILILILFTGLREGEAIGLTWDCVDFQKGALKVYRQLQKRPVADGGYTFCPLKNSKTRVIKLSPYVVTVLTNQKAKQAAEKLKAGASWQGFQNVEERKTALVFTNEKGLNIAAETIRLNFKKVAAAVGVPQARVHDLRHTYAVNCLQCGDDFKTVQAALGHATAAFTLDVYGHVSERMREESAKRQEEYIKSLGLQA